MPIHPLPQFEEDLAAYEADKKAYDALETPSTIVVRFGYMKLVGEFPYSGTAKPGCGSKIVVRTHRGKEIGEMLTSTCPNSGCSKSVTRKEMLEYIDNSGGKDYPFFEGGRAMRVATGEDMKRQEELDAGKKAIRDTARSIARELGLTAEPGFKIVEAEPILGGERLTVYVTAENRCETRQLAQRLSVELNTRTDVRQVGARDEARLTADYEKCGQYCCCKNFLKVLKPVSMKSAKVQKATLDPLKISGRCGRLMCCLRYEDQTYDELRKKLPHRKSRVGTPHGDGMVIDSQILTQLVRIRLDDGEVVAVPVEELAEPVLAKAPPLSEMLKPRPLARSGPRTPSKPAVRTPKEGADRTEPKAEPKDGATKKKRRRKRRKPDAPQQQPGQAKDGETDRRTGEQADDGSNKKKRRRRRRRKPGSGGESGPPKPSGDQ